MALAMDVKVGNPLRKLVLLKLCDNANDQGECWPSFQHIADQCEISKRSAINHVQALQDEGFLMVKPRFREGEKISNLYFIDLSKAHKKVEEGSAAFAPPPDAGNALGGAGDSPPSAGDAPPPSAGDAHRTSHSFESVNEPVITNKTKTKNKLDFSCWPELPEQQVMDDWIAMRKRAKADVSQTVINRFGKELRKAKTFGFSVDHCLTECVTRNWRGFECQWLLNSSGGASNHAANKFSSGVSASPAKMPHADVVRGQARRAFERLNGENGSGAVYPDGRVISQQG